ncbi:PREDICTED: piggyBac transposable element-derived protein 4-like isoform X2 [Polistes dominula]|nr:PREDICTED: piggyBac transposable element-derived protein 4-like isoform X2 [Polistes dominula]XP_015186434.1 PREDICTED: piggyBac transposable element-derived protein 4-like isoform X2 [Polistes dominula]XP_015186435.1 PREDICTED: piggyBac transposable element-derived protein 4-like isoform X2 [Polistes dominula]XP_015186436.1 PREDICTED: piggyBac transposable element-derived protein 4-like isoform X2 [Polistes dominula]XP_015186437.1 PREDICTED: piggyBac transposable element-derived protein 4-l
MSSSDSNDDLVSPIMKKRRLEESSSSEDVTDKEIESDTQTDSSISEYTDSSDNESKTEDEDTNATWNIIGGNREPFQFSAKPGLQQIVPKRFRNKCMFYMEKYLNDELIGIIVEQTNLYANQFLQSQPNLKPHSRMKKWYPTCNNEIRCFIALLILQGIVKKPTLQMYYSKRECISTPFFSKVMSRDRFVLLCKFLHFENNQLYDQKKPKTKMTKIKTVLDNILEKCQSLYIPQLDICIDELLPMWKGRLSWKHYIPSKRNRFGIKFLVLCESESGYVWNFFVYSNKNTDYDQRYLEFKISERIVLQLCSDLLYRGYRLYLNNCYTSIPLIEKLCEYKTDVVGTIRKSRIGIPSDVIKLPIRKGEYAVKFKNKIMLMKWKNKREVYLASTVHNDNMIKIEKRKIITRKPEVVIDYNKKMGGVDLSDGIIIAYSAVRKRLKKYYKRIFLHLLDIICLNAFILYKKNNGSLSRINFLMEFVEETITSYQIQGEKSTQTIRQPTYHVTRLVGNHVPNYIPGTSKSNPTRRCSLCSKRKIRKETRYLCTTCKVPLCVVPCFGEYHSKTEI